MTATKTGLRGISLVCVPTVDQDRAIEFYESLGFEKRADEPFGGAYRWVEVYPPEGVTGIALAPPPDGQPVTPTQTGITLTTTDIDATHAELRARRRRGRRGVADGRSCAAAVLVPRPDGTHADGGRAALRTESDAAGRDFAALVDTHRAELHAHCYRMLGSVHDADDALQETMIRAWRGAAGLRDDRSARSWLYAIATNVCLTEIERRRRRMLPYDFAPAVDGNTPPGIPVTESVWIEPYPDAAAGLSAGKLSPEAQYEQLESVALAFVAAAQHLGANQRAVLLLRDVLGFTAQETASMLSASVASVNSALQRARSTVSARVPQRAQQETLRSLGDTALRELVDRYIAAWERNDVHAFAAMLTDDATFAMPPLSTWYAPRAEVVAWAHEYSISGAWRWKALLSQANGQPALAFYARDTDAGAYLPFALNVLTLRNDLVSDVTAFIVRATDADDPEAYIRFPEQPMHRSFLDLYDRFGLPSRLQPDR